MSRHISTSSIANALPFAPAVKKTTGEGEVVNPYDLSFTWKVKAEQTSFQFSVYEMKMEPGKFIPLHIHPYAEFFYCLEGTVSAMQIDSAGNLSWVDISAGECVNAPANNPHGMKNRSGKPARFLSVSTYEHEKSFNDYGAFLQTKEGQNASEEKKVETLNGLFDRYNVTFLEPTGA